MPPTPCENACSSVSNVASRTYKKDMLLQLWGSFRTSNWDAPRLPTQKRSQKGRLRNGETAWPGELKDTVFWPALGWSSMSNVASRTYKKEMLLQLWGSFRTSNWLWDAPRLPTQKRSQKGRLRNGETAWPGELKDTVFWPALGWSSMSNVASRTYKKEMLLQLWGSFRTSNWLWDAPRLPTQKRSQKGRLRNGETAWPGELKDTVFWPALGWSSMSNVASRTYKKEMLLQLWGSFRTSNWLWDAPRLPTQKRSQKGRLRNGETAWPGELKDTVFWPALGWSSMSNVASRTYKKRWKSGFVASRFARRNITGFRHSKHWQMDSDSWLFLDAMGDERSCSVLGVCCVGGAFVCACVFDVVCFGQPPLGALPLVGRGRRIYFLGVLRSWVVSISLRFLWVCVFFNVFEWFLMVS